MGSLIRNIPTLIFIRKFAKIELPTSRRHWRNGVRFSKLRTIFSYSASSGSGSGSGSGEDSVQELTVPTHWLQPSRASQESEWLRVTLHKWLDDEYCPEPTNIEISKIAADSFYKSLMEKRADLGDILIKMAVELESISYQESFHGAFSSANAAVTLITQRILLE
ncbi:hypothetical protein ABFS82_14G128800 [Erythranthe guttata]|uniref:Uncharacterized protein n=1 Tax=Erythranthe guttata TaxID=4155 RepID=A0A022RK27_ERYGU|nr:PREDICTED: uncharacterized protein LOC105954688 [Erythranthe guttata]EYU40521.1 hypothetical protein MIMGU_mgv1a015229mg [Erythranthe guttata]|eukprot:XP_012833824.1 PREDICTED: uncharacterized protein LOC105954688 [Erythranthe guttata]